MSAADQRPSSGRILVHLPQPAPPRLIDKPATRPPIGEELLPGWKVCDYSLIRNDLGGEEYEYEAWVMPTSSDCC